jgi:hypothetical protein
MSSELKKIERLFAVLMKRPLIVFPAAGEKLEATTKQGVYVIYSPTNHPVHVGRTVRGKWGIAQRLKNHLQAQSSFTVQYLKGDGPRLRGRYRFQYIEVPGARQRALLEAYAIAHLLPRHLGLGRRGGIGG